MEWTLPDALFLLTGAAIWGAMLIPPVKRWILAPDFDGSADDDLAD